MTAAGKDGGVSDREGGNVRDGVEICSAAAVADPQALPACGLEAGVVAFALCTQSIDPLETQTVAVDGETAVVGNGLVLCAAAVFSAVVPVFVVAGALPGFGLAERTAASQILCKVQIAA